MICTTRFTRTLIHLLLILILTGPAVSVESAETSSISDPYAVYCTWIDDPTTRMVIQFLDYASNRTASTIEFRPKGRTEWTARSGTSVPHPYTGNASTTVPAEPLRLVHTVQLTGLRPGTDYEFRFSESGERFRFRTMPANLRDNEVRVAVGGDLYHIRSEMQNTMRLVAERDPHFVIIGGDWAYADGLEEKMWRWDHLWEDWMRYMKDSEGRLIPVVPVIGNHETIGGFRNTREYSPYFYSYFPFPSKGYGVLDFRDYLSVIALDTEHSNPVISGGDPQTIWLRETLDRRRDVDHIIAVHHLTTYPSHRDFHGERETRIRQRWHPLFERYDVGLVFEHHDHTYHRSEPIREGEVHPMGIRYLGAGNWGTHTRDVRNPHTTWYLEEAFGTVYKPGIDENPDDPHPLTGTSANPVNARHFYLLTVSGADIKVESVNGHGEVFHTLSHQSRIARAPLLPPPGIDNFDTVPSQFTLFQNYPNPFNNRTVIRFGLPETSTVRVTVHDLQGRKIALLVDEKMDAGYHHVAWQADVSSGLYFYTIEAISPQTRARKFNKSNRMILLR